LIERTRQSARFDVVTTPVDKERMNSSLQIYLFVDTVEEQKIRQNPGEIFLPRYSEKLEEFSKV